MTWSKFHIFLSTHAVQNGLERKYQKLGIPNASECAYQNSYPFTYALKHAESFFQQGKIAPVQLKPILYFYGLVQLLKACILTIDPYYPETSSVLAHGVTTRKKKKQHYQFLSDEVKIQKNGLYAHACFKLFDLKGVEADKFSMHTLMKKIPEMEQSFVLLGSKAHLSYVTREQERWKLPIHMADTYHLTPQRFAERLGKELGFSLENLTLNEEYATFTSSRQINPFFSQKLMFSQKEQSFALPNIEEDLFPLPELLSHYLILYNLGMISRYETEWWYDLLLSHSSDDLVYITQFLEITEEKVPYLVWCYLGEEMV
ncbi:YaaC family protein [Metabacillus sp. GX 13764]|uniref:YaaC family protein n=1 Tax=Metabacillus kandeliae TaxID=2900151 RepID=UPI001E447928|nr:YaaC family protein [Metabacillus kandeliae]MCD7036738.1 YaaC family protein [Metabacillus kandeliae]